MSRAPWLILLLVALFGVFVRGYRLGTPAISNDEAFAWRIAVKPLPELLINAAGDTTPPAHYLLLKGWIVFSGSSPESLRALSVLCGVLAIVAAYALAAETALWGRVCNRVARMGGLCASLLTALHSFQLAPSRTARMYSLGALLALLTAWLLLRALRAKRRPLFWWSAYGVAAATFLYTHHFAVVTLVPQVAFVLWCAFRPGGNDALGYAKARIGIGIAAILVLLLYSPWIPAGLAQLSRVSNNFWITQPSAREWSEAFVRWCVGFEAIDSQWIALGFAVAALVTARVLRSGNAAAVALLAQAAFPWIATMLISTLGERPLLQDRYLAFGQASWLVLLGTVVGSISLPLWRTAAATLLVGVTLVGTQQFLSALPEGDPGIVAASERLARDYRAPGVVLVQQAPDLNCLKYYLSQLGATDVDIRAIIRPQPSDGHINHVASLGSEEFLSRVDDLPDNVSQLWIAGVPNRIGEGTAMPGWKWIEETVYKGHGPQAPAYVLRRYERPTN